jgi:hypothetical protein
MDVVSGLFRAVKMLESYREKQMEALKAKRSRLLILPTHGECLAVMGQN